MCVVFILLGKHQGDILKRIVYFSFLILFLACLYRYRHQKVDVSVG